ncbi:MAG: phosphodiester glycosidase family protein [Leptolyngbyaceae cyanobacterium SM1_1_3]|nr:phosphodiester glycosidase family protein [Leptolyngbyaceae cyanobacterium SM1_1_3]NJN02834.1 phosphodiester glycosidase family protein [Leptolyngbyaceae cyanobacterium RM1_1_2]NJO11606.1 phosphodiester glycosidase family protein [Leptolyngbyaceae cyanobacterium SL_1_1]
MRLVNRRLGLGLLLVAIASFLIIYHQPEPPAAEKTLAAESVFRPTIAFETVSLTNATLYVLTVPSSYEVTVALAEGLATVRDIAQQTGAIAALNAGFFDPQNGQTTSYVVHRGELVADPRQNQRLVDNPDLQAYLPQILNRSEFRRYQCAAETRYNIAAHDAPVPPSCSLIEAIGAGPQLLPADTSETEGFVTYDSGGQQVRDALGAQQRNARTAVGILADGSLVWTVAAQQPQAPTSSGFSLAEMAEFLRSLGAVQALNLDGGSSSSLYYQGSLSLGRVDPQGNFIERPVHSVLLVHRQPEQG